MIQRRRRPILSALTGALLAGAAFCAPGALAGERPTGPSRPPQDDIVYFLLVDRFDNADPGNDRGGLAGDRYQHGFDPTDMTFYNGGDLKGVTRRLDYLQGLGVTAIWVSPIFRNQVVQTFRERTSAGYHGYWILDFTDVDPHFGTREDFAALVAEAHRRGIKVILDIVINHTGDIIQYRECHDPAVAGPQARRGADCPYRPVGEPEYTPFIAAGEEQAKTPGWLNDPALYNNRGESTFEGESSLLGDFAGLDDVRTTDPRVVQGMIDIYRQWITDFRIDGYRIDTARHVDTAFWQQFIPAILDHARAVGIPDFYIFGEVFDYDPAVLARFTREDGFPAVLDFAFQGTAVGVASGREAPAALAQLFAQDKLYAEGAPAILPTFLGNHDMGRVGWFLRKDRPGMDEAETLKRAVLAHGVMMFSRGVPVLYYGDEQGFAHPGNYSNSREPMFPSQVEAFNAGRLIGTDATPAVDNFDTGHPLYRAIAEMAAIRTAQPALRGGDQRVLQADTAPGVLALLRGAAGDGVLVVANNADTARPVDVELPGAGAVRPLLGDCAATVAQGRLRLQVPPLSVTLCRLGG